MLSLRATIVLLVLSTAGGCVNRVTRPAVTIAPVRIYVADHGLHSSLLLPKKDGYVQYAFGDWRPFAMNHNSLLEYARAAFFSNRSALGREPHPTTRPAELRRRTRARLLAIDVERADAEWLRMSLESEFARNRDAAVDNRQVRMSLIPYDGPQRRYSLWNNCNHATSRWLRRMHVGSPRWAMFSRFEAR
jgi:hypothetical protein